MDTFTTDTELGQERAIGNEKLCDWEVEQLLPDQKHAIITIANNLCRENLTTSDTHEAFAKLQKLGFTLWRFKKFKKMEESPIFLIESNNEERTIPSLQMIDLGHETIGSRDDSSRVYATAANEDDPFRTVLQACKNKYRDHFHYRGQRLVDGSRGGYSFSEIDKYILPEFAQSMGVPRERLRLPTQKECLWTQSDTGQNRGIKEWFNDGAGREPVVNCTISALRERIYACGERIHCISDDSIFGLHSDKIQLERLTKEAERYDNPFFRGNLRGNSRSADFVPSGSNSPNSYFRCLIELNP